MKQYLYMSTFTVFLLFCAPSLYAVAWTVLLWEGVKEIAAGVAVELTVDFFKSDNTPEQLRQLNERLNQLTAQLEAQKQAKKYSSEAEFNNLVQLAEQLKAMYAVMADSSIPVEKRIAMMETELNQVWKQLDALNNEDKGIVTIAKDPPSAKAKTTALEGFDFKMNYVYRTQGAGEFKPLTNGMTLRSGDYYKIIFEPGQDGYIYLFQMDSANKLYQLFPMQSFGGVTVNHRNPVKAGQRYYIPAQDKSFVLDDQTGQEKLYFTASRQPDVVLENFYKAFENATGQNKTRIQTQLAKSLLEVKGISQIAKDTSGKPVTWQEEGQTYQVPQQSLPNFCSSCVNVLTFEHR